MPNPIPIFNTKKFLRACRKINLIVDKKSGKGSHVKIINPENRQSFPVPNHLPKGLQIAIIKKLESWGYDRDRIIKLLTVSLFILFKNIFKK